VTARVPDSHLSAEPAERLSERRVAEQLVLVLLPAAEDRVEHRNRLRERLRVLVVRLGDKGRLGVLDRHSQMLGWVDPVGLRGVRRTLISAQAWACASTLEGGGECHFRHANLTMGNGERPATEPPPVLERVWRQRFAPRLVGQTLTLMYRQSVGRRT
jgi:hypothetical protein